MTFFREEEVVPSEKNELGSSILTIVREDKTLEVKNKKNNKIKKYFFMFI